MKDFATKRHPSKSVVLDAAWMIVFALRLMLVGVAATCLFVTHARSQGIATGMGMAQDKVQATDAKDGAREVSIDNFSFTPMEMTILAGTQVTWINKDDVPHTVVSVSHNFKSQALDTDEKFSFTFSKPGSYEYFCSVHPKMTGKIVVR